MDKGQIISGEFAKVLVRKKSDQKIELGELMVAEAGDGSVLMQVFDLQYGSQISQANLELISGLMLEEDQKNQMFDENLRNYTLAAVKPLIMFNNRNAKLCKNLPRFLSKVRELKKDDLSFLARPEKELFLGNLRSGSSVIDVDIILDGQKVFSHHILIPATTGRGKSNLTKVILWEQLDKDYCGILVLDPHDEYFGRNGKGLKDHPDNSQVSYYTTSNVPPGQKTLKINVESLRPEHFNGVVPFSDPQKQALYVYHSQFGNRWIEAIIKGRQLKDVSFHDDTRAVVKRRMITLLNIRITPEGELVASGVFDMQAGKSTVSDICDELERSKTVIVDTSNFSGSIEILIGTLITSEIFRRYKRYKMKGVLGDRPVISVVLEEAPRVLGKEVLERGSNIFSTIAREGRKFGVGLTAITQLPSMIQRDILANMNTKIILGLELTSERQAVIESASQDLSTDSRNIASLDIGEAIVTSNFSRFAVPLRIPYFEDLVTKTQNKRVRDRFSTEEFQKEETLKSDKVQNMISKREFPGVKLRED